MLFNQYGVEYPALGWTVTVLVITGVGGMDVGDSLTPQMQQARGFIVLQ
jgi:hypothetical protein